jgi:hypothetical protein
MLARANSNLLDWTVIKVHLHEFLTWALDGVKRSATQRGHITLREEGLSITHWLVIWVCPRKKSLPQQEIEPLRVSGP